jgi:hypothetical protein
VVVEAKHSVSAAAKAVVSVVAGDAEEVVGDRSRVANAFALVVVLAEETLAA